ncbi:unnamed protein product [Symbiodinium sp. CCMP2592]|nr:unnamed protein product [Symbiodinium sp. CCMP2592]
MVACCHLRSTLAGAGRLGTDSNRKRRASIAERWGALPALEKAKWQAKAHEIEQRRRAVATTSFSDSSVAETSNLASSQLKRLYSQRLGKTVKELAEQDVWTCGLGLQNHHSPLRPELVRDLDRAGLAECCRETFGYDAEMLRNPPGKLPTFCRSCLWAHGGICEKQACFAEVGRLVHQLDTGLQSKHVATSLLVLKLREENTEHTQWFFLGCVCRRPLLHVLARLWPRAPGRLAISMTGAVPALLTSHQMFLSIIRFYLSQYDEFESDLPPAADMEFTEALKAEAAAFKDAEAAPASASSASASSAGAKPAEGQAVEQDSKSSNAGSAAASAARVAGSTGVVFQRTLGLLDIGPSPRKGLTCMSCGGKIDKGGLKFSFAYRYNKPPRSIHVACVPLIQKDLIRPCIDSLHRLLKKPDVQQSELLEPACKQALQFLEG